MYIKTTNSLYINVARVKYSDELNATKFDQQIIHLVTTNDSDRMLARLCAVLLALVCQLEIRHLKVKEDVSPMISEILAIMLSNQAPVHDACVWGPDCLHTLWIDQNIMKIIGKF